MIRTAWSPMRRGRDNSLRHPRSPSNRTGLRPRPGKAPDPRIPPPRAAAPPHPAPDGFTLLEVTISVAIFAILGYGIMMVTRATQLGYSEMMAATNENRGLRKAMLAVTTNLKFSSGSTVTLDTSNTNYDALSYQIPVGVDNDATLFGYKDSSGAGQAGWRVTFTVENNNLVKKVTDDTGTQQIDTEILLMDIDDALNGVKGFDVTQLDSDLYAITIRTAVAFRNTTRRETQTTTIHLKN